MQDLGEVKAKRLLELFQGATLKAFGVDDESLKKEKSDRLREKRRNEVGLQRQSVVDPILESGVYLFVFTVL